MTIYFDNEHNAYGDELSIAGKEIVYTCSNELWQEFNDYPDKYIWDNDEIVPNPEYERIELNKAKQDKIRENDTARDTALNGGVTYKNVLFDSDTDQKINLLGAVRKMTDETITTWFGMNNEPLECTKEDLFNIGDLIEELDAFCWTKNAEIKAEIAEAATIEELDAIEINYELLAVEDINGSNGGEQAS